MLNPFILKTAWGEGRGSPPVLRTGQIADISNQEFAPCMTAVACLSTPDVKGPHLQQMRPGLASWFLPGL
jgi:hypothetical protein